MLTEHRYNCEIRTPTVNRTRTHRRHDDHSTSGNQHIHQLRTLLLHTLLRLPTRMDALHLAPNTSQLLRDRVTPMLLPIRMLLVHRHPQVEECHQLEDHRLREVIQQVLHQIPTTKPLHMTEHLFLEHLRGMLPLRSMLHGDLPWGQVVDLQVDTLKPSLLHERLLLPGDMLDMNSNAGLRHKLRMGTRKLLPIRMVRTVVPELLLLRVVLLSTQTHPSTYKDIRC